MKYAYSIIPLGPFGGACQTLWTSAEPTADKAGNFAIAEEFAAHFTQATVTLKFAAPGGGVYGLTYFTITRRGYEPLTILVHLL